MRYRIQALLLLISIRIPHTASIAQRSGSRSDSKRISNSATGEQEAANFWRTYVTACGSSHYVKRSHAVFVELRGFRVEMRHDPITEADRLNGVQAKGTTSFAATAYRFYEKSAWQPWGNGIPESMNLYNAVRFQRTRGKWTFQPVGYFSRFAQPVTCGEVPGFRSPSANETATNSIQISDYHNFPIERFFFWNSGNNEISERFAQSTATYINWKLEYSGTAFTYKAPPVEAVWFKDGIKWGSQSGSFSNVGKGRYWAGKGWEEAGHWEPGRYTVKIYVRKQLVRVGEFEIVADEKLPALLRYDDEGIYSLEEEAFPYQIWFRFSRNGKVVYLFMPKIKGDSPWGCPSTLGGDSLGRAQICLKTDKFWGPNDCDRCNTRMVGTYTVTASQIEITLNELSYTPKELQGKEGTRDSFTGTIEHNRLSLSCCNSPSDKFKFTAARVWVR